MMDKVRKRWLVAIVVSTLLGGLQSCLPTAAQFQMTTYQRYMTLLLAFSGFGIALYCAYLKKGTKWLMFQIIFLPVTSIVILSLFLFNSGVMKSSFSQIQIYCMLIAIPISVWYLVCNVQLRKVNLQWKREHLSEVFSESNQKHIRLHWLISLFTIAALRYTVTVTAFTMKSLTTVPFAAFIGITLVYTSLAYYFSYHKKGTKWLLTLMIMSLFVFFFDAMNLGHLTLQQDRLMLLFRGAMALNIWFFVRSIALYELNKLKISRSDAIAG